MSSHPFFDTRPTQAAEESVDHLCSTENQLQAAGGQQSAEQSDVKLHHILGLRTFPPLGAVRQVTLLTVRNGQKHHELQEVYRLQHIP